MHVRFSGNFRQCVYGKPKTHWLILSYKAPSEPARHRMAVLRSHFFGATAAFAFILGTAGCSTAGLLGPASAPSPEVAVRCRELYGLWMRYNSRDHNLSGEHAQAELALSNCQRGDVDTGLVELEHLLQEDEIPFQRRRDESASKRPSPSARTTWAPEAVRPMRSSDVRVGDPS